MGFRSRRVSQLWRWIRCMPTNLTSFAGEWANLTIDSSQKKWTIVQPFVYNQSIDPARAERIMTFENSQVNFEWNINNFSRHMAKQACENKLCWHIGCDVLRFNVYLLYRWCFSSGVWKHVLPLTFTLDVGFEGHKLSVAVVLWGFGLVISWLVVYLPLWKIWVWWNSQHMESQKNHVPNHQPIFVATLWSIHNTAIVRWFS